MCIELNININLYFYFQFLLVFYKLVKNIYLILNTIYCLIKQAND